MDKVPLIQLVMQLCIFLMLIASYALVSTPKVKTKWTKIAEVFLLYGITFFYAFSKAITTITFVSIAIGVVLFNLIKANTNERRIKGLSS